MKNIHRAFSIFFTFTLLLQSCGASALAGTTNALADTLSPSLSSTLHSVKESYLHALEHPSFKQKNPIQEYYLTEEEKQALTTYNDILSGKTIRIPNRLAEEKKAISEWIERTINRINDNPSMDHISLQSRIDSIAHELEVPIKGLHTVSERARFVGIYLFAERMHALIMPNKPYTRQTDKSHYKDVLSTVLKLNPEADLAEMVAAMFHDIPRWLPGAQIGELGKKYDGNVRKKRLHPLNSSKYTLALIGDFLTAEEEKQVAFLIMYHDAGPAGLTLPEDTGLPAEFSLKPLAEGHPRYTAVNRLSNADAAVFFLKGTIHKFIPYQEEKGKNPIPRISMLLERITIQSLRVQIYEKAVSWQEEETYAKSYTLFLQAWLEVPVSQQVPDVAALRESAPSYLKTSVNRIDRSI